MKTCANCGAQNQDIYRFCSTCGQKLEAAGYYTGANELMAQGRHAEALQVLSEALVLDEYNPVVLTKIDRCCGAIRDKALHAYRQAFYNIVAGRLNDLRQADATHAYQQAFFDIVADRLRKIR